MHFNITCADILDWAAEYDGPPFHCILADPPYGWHFMGRKKLDGDIALRPDTWAALARHLHPGAFIFAFGGPRTYHRLACAMEDAGLRLFPPIGWIMGSGFPKATNIHVQLEKTLCYKRDGKWFYEDTDEPMRTKSPFRHPDADKFYGHRYGLQAIKPAIEFIAVAQKPYEGRPMDCIVETGAGTLWIDGGRIGLRSDDQRGEGGRKHIPQAKTAIFGGTTGSPMLPNNIGRWPANFALCHSLGCIKTGVKRVAGDKRGVIGGKIQYNYDGHGIYGASQHRDDDRTPAYGDPDGLETVDDWCCVDDCPVRLLGEQSGELKSGIKSLIQNGWGEHGIYGQGKPHLKESVANEGTAARFFFQAHWQHEIAERLAGLEMPVMYCPKAARKERNDGLDDFYWKRDKSSQTGFVRVTKEEWETLDEKERAQGNIHPTQKPISLTKWLATLLLPPKEYAPRRVFVPFAGKMSEAVGAMLAGFEEIEAIELIQDYCDAGKARMEFWSDGRQLQLAL